MVTEAMGNEEMAEANADSSGRRIATTQVITDPATLQPTTASMELDIELTMDGETHRQVEKRDWAFDWPAADCAS